MDIDANASAPATADAVMSTAPTTSATDASAQNEKPESLQDAVDSTLLVVEATAAAMASLHAEKEHIAFTLQSAVSKLRAENVALREKLGDDANDATVSPMHAQKRLDEAKAADERVASLETELAELRLSHARLEREKLDGETALVSKMKQSADDGSLIQGLRAQVTELLQARAVASAGMAAQSAAGAKLLRDAGEQAAVAAGAAKRVEFLEGERVRLSAAVAEARAQHEIAAGEAAARAQATEASARGVREELEGARKRADKLAGQVSGLTATVESLQKQRDQSRDSALEEVKKMKDIMDARIEAANDAEARAEKYKRLLQTVSDNNRHMVPTAVPTRQSLDDAAEALLRDMQATLDQKLADLAEQRCELEHARVERVKLASEFQGLVRAASEARTERDEAIALGEAATSKVAELKKRVSELEERIILAASPALPMRTPGSSYGGGFMMTPREAGIAPGMMDVDEMDDGEGVARAISAMKRVQEKHESVLATLRRTQMSPSN